MEQMQTVFLKLAVALNNRNVNWGIGGSYLLYLKGIVNTCNDLDFVIDPLDEQNVLDLLLEYNIEYESVEKGSIYGTRQLIRFIYENVEVDFLIGFIVKDFVYPSGKFLAPEVVQIKGVEVHLCDLKDWLYAYQMIGRKQKVQLLEQYLNK
jgi:predicted nucleotidyltransferase